MSGFAQVGVIGLGYVGLPLALTLAESDQQVLGFDIDGDKIEALAAGRSYLQHIPDQRVVAAGRRFAASTDLARIAGCDAVVICVPTPLDPHHNPDLSYVEATCRSLAPHLQPGTLVVLESTTWPGTTEEVVAPLLAAGSGLTVGRDLLLAFSPEREDPGNERWTTRTIPKLVGGLDPAATSRAVDLYRICCDTVVPVSHAKVAEAAKLYENIFRSVNIALANETKMVLEAMGIDVWEVIRAAATKPFGFMPFWPGPGLGGHCIPIDPFYLAWKAREYGVDSRFIALAGEINRAMPAWVVARVADCLNDAGKALRGSRLLLWGVAYKPQTNDTRESPSLALIELLEAKGARVDYHDPFVPTLPATRRHPSLAGRASVAPSGDYDAFLVATAHRAFTAEALAAHGVPVIDTRGLDPAFHRA